MFFCVDAAVSLHNQLLTHLLRLPKSFFDTNPSGTSDAFHLRVCV
jgi:ATP-binding cassette subfamily C (CFTR/MRP) protein 1